MASKEVDNNLEKPDKTNNDEGKSDGTKDGDKSEKTKEYDDDSESEETIPKTIIPLREAGVDKDGLTREGYNYELVKIPSNLNVDVMCVFCRMIIRDTVQISTCGHAFCSSCWLDWIERCRASGDQVSCPVDKQLVDVKDVFRDKKHDRFIRSLRVYCFNRESHCSITPELQYVEIMREDLNLELVKQNVQAKEEIQKLTENCRESKYEIERLTKDNLEYKVEVARTRGEIERLSTENVELNKRLANSEREMHRLSEEFERFSMLNEDKKGIGATNDVIGPSSEGEIQYKELVEGAHKVCPCKWTVKVPGGYGWGDGYSPSFHTKEGYHLKFRLHVNIGGYCVYIYIELVKGDRDEQVVPSRETLAKSLSFVDGETNKRLDVIEVSLVWCDKSTVYCIQIKKRPKQIIVYLK